MTIHHTRDASTLFYTHPLFFAPYYNVGQSGDVCLGTMRRPTSRSIEAIREWEASFFGSEFTHPLPGAVLTRRRGGFAALWQSLVPKRGRRQSKTFPSSALAPAPKKQTLLAFIQAAERGVR